MEETVERLLSDLEEAKGSFDIIIENMKEEGINYPYDKLTTLVDQSIHRIEVAIGKIKDINKEYKSVCDNNKALVVKLNLIKYCRAAAYLALVNLTALFGNRIDNAGALFITRLLATLGGMFTIDLALQNVQDKMVSKSFKNVDTYTSMTSLRGEFKENYGMADNDIDTIRSINRNLWEELKQPRVLSFRRKERVENELKE